MMLFWILPLSIVSANYCISKDRNLCLSGYDFVDSDDISDVKCGTVWPPSISSKIFVVNSSTHIFTAGATCQSLTIEGYTPTASLKVNLDSTTALLLELDIKNVHLLLKSNITSATMTLNNAILTAQEVAKKLTLKVNSIITDGNSLRGLLEVQTNKIELTSIAQNLVDDVIVRLNLGWGSLQKSVIRAMNTNRQILLGKRRILVNSGASGEKSIVMKSRYMQSFSILHDQASLLLSRYGNPRPTDLLPIDIELSGGILSIANQTWARVSSSILPSLFNSMMNIVHKAPTEIRIQGRNVPVNIKNNCNNPMEIIAESLQCGIQGKLELKTALDKIKNIAQIPFEFGVASIKAPNGIKLNVSGMVSIFFDSSDVISHITDLYQNITSNVKAMIRSVSVKLTTLAENTLNLAYGAVVSVGFTVGDTISKGLVRVLQNLTMPSHGKAILQLAGDIKSNSNFSVLKSLITQPVSIFCSKESFDCEKWEIKIDNALPMPSIKKTCAQIGDEFCLQMGLHSLPEWISEKYCFALSPNNCPSGSLSIGNASLSEILNGVHSTAKQVALNIRDSLNEGITLNIGELHTIHASLSLVGTSSKPNIKLNLGVSSQDKVANLSLNGLSLDLSASSSQGSLNINIPDVSFRNVSLTNLPAHISFSSDRVSLDSTSLIAFGNTLYKNLFLNIDQPLDTLELTNGHWLFKAGSTLKQQVNATMIQRSFAAAVNLLSKLDISIEPSSTSTHGFNLTISGTQAKPISFIGDWSTVVDFGQGLTFNADCDLTITGLPINGNVSFSGSGNVNISPTGVSVNVVDNMHVTANKKFTLPSGKQISFENIVFDRTRTTGLSVQTGSNAGIAIVKNAHAEVGATVSIEDMKLTSAFRFEPGSMVEVRKLELTTRQSSSVSTGEELVFEYKFGENNVPKLTVDNIIGTPASIRVVYNATSEEHSSVEFNEWVNYPQTIIFANDFDCETWSKLVTFESNCPLVPSSNLKMSTICEYDEDESSDENGKIALQIVLLEEPISSSSGSDSSSSSGIASTIIFSSLAVIAIVGIFAGGYFYLRDSTDDAIEYPLA